MTRIRAYHLPLVLGLLLGAAHWPMPARSATDGVVVCSPTDAYRELAQAISAETGYPVVAEPGTALAQDPLHLIWVAAPDDFSDGHLVGFGLQVRDRASAVSVGFITGRTLDQAQAFWDRSHQVSATRCAIANADFATAGRYRNRLIRVNGDQWTPDPLSLRGFREALSSSDYATFTGHGTPTRLRLSEKTSLVGADIPELDGLVLMTGSCNAFRFWQSDSLALALIERGAAAVAGFAYSPNGGYLLGAFNDLPLRHTWPEFPIGHAVQVLNHGCRQGFANFPFFLLAGDPRASLRSDRPYDVVADEAHGETRVLRLKHAPAGVLPIRVPGGAAYRYVQVPGVGTGSRDDWFYNARLQMADLGDDKFLLVVQPGGDVTIELRANPPIGWRIGQSLLASLDSSLILAMNHAGDVLQTIVGGLAWLGIGGVMRRQNRVGALRAPVGLGVAAAAALALYQGLRLPYAVVTTKPLEFTGLAVIGVCLTVSAAAWLVINGRRPLSRCLGFLLPGLLLLVGAVFLVVILSLWARALTQRIGAPTWNFHLVWPHLVSFFLFTPVWVVVAWRFRFHTRKVPVRPSLRDETTDAESVSGP